MFFVLLMSAKASTQQFTKSIFIRHLGGELISANVDFHKAPRGTKKMTIYYDIPHLWKCLLRTTREIVKATRIAVVYEYDFFGYPKEILMRLDTVSLQPLYNSTSVICCSHGRDSIWTSKGRVILNAKRVIDRSNYQRWDVNYDLAFRLKKKLSHHFKTAERLDFFDQVRSCFQENYSGKNLILDVYKNKNYKHVLVFDNAKLISVESYFNQKYDSVSCLFDFYITNKASSEYSYIEMQDWKTYLGHNCFPAFQNTLPSEYKDQTAVALGLFQTDSLNRITKMRLLHCGLKKDFQIRYNEKGDFTSIDPVVKNTYMYFNEKGDWLFRIREQPVFNTRDTVLKVYSSYDYIGVYIGQDKLYMTYNSFWGDEIFFSPDIDRGNKVSTYDARVLTYWDQETLGQEFIYDFLKFD